MGERTAVIIAVVFSLFLLGSLAGFVFASSVNWFEVARFTGYGTNAYSTNEFICNHAEWRIIWEYIPNSQDSNLTLFAVFVYPIQQGFRGPTYLDSIIRNGTEDTKGISFIHDYHGTFTLNINAVDTESYSIIIEQNIDSIPEFPSWTIPTIFLAISVVIVIFRIKFQRRRPY